MRNFFRYKSVVLVTVGAIVVTGIVFSFGYYFGKHDKAEADKVADVINKNPTAGTAVDFAPFWQVWNTINEKYVPTNSTTTERVNDQARVYGAIEGAVAALGDPYTVFFPPVESKIFSEQISGTLEGVGMEVDVKDGVLTVIAPLKGTPAYRAGMKTGDRILKINDRITDKLTTTEAVKLIRGPKGTQVVLNVVRAGVKGSFDVSITRDVINQPTVDTKIIGDVFVIQLYSFSAISPNLFRDALREFVESDKYKLILDLRGNPGGYLDAAVDMASWFLPTGDVVVTEDFRNQSDNQIYRSKGYNIFTDKLKMAVLIDGGSASASEILAGALHDHGVATLVGSKSFGKGSVQELVNITPTTSLKVTIAKWLTPNGTSISHQGLTPDTVVPLDEKAFLKDKTDTQMDKAVEILDKS